MGSNHWVGPCTIGKVVDSNTKVMGTDNLFVIDVSYSFFIQASPCTDSLFFQASIVSNFLKLNSTSQIFDLFVSNSFLPYPSETLMVPSCPLQNKV